MSEDRGAMILYWDFFGPDAAGTAEHFRRHLEQFLAGEAIDGCMINLESAGAGHHAVACRPPTATATATIVARLRPRRQVAAG